MNTKVLDLLKRAKALLRGHFALKSTRHSRWYVNKDELYTDPSAVCEVGREMAEIIYKRCRE
ncbi:hypothetical protein KW782_04075, partial [Candidatus Parcubacteria bacterium]|nr:hypothetical protein [Candidatus Parcubacteria bacterium]